MMLIFFLLLPRDSVVLIGDCLRFLPLFWDSFSFYANLGNIFRNRLKLSWKLLL